MGYCDVKNPPEFNMQIEKWDRTTRDDGEEMAKPIEKLFNNTLYNQREIEKIAGKFLRNITLNVSDWDSSTYTIIEPEITSQSDVSIMFSFDSILAAQKANIQGKTEDGKLILVAKKIPTMDIVIDEIHIQNLRKEG